jgi:CRP-like cAMP-binding protein
MPNPLATVLERRDRLTPEEIRLVEGLLDEPHPVAAGTDLVRQGDNPHFSTLMLSGLSARYNILNDGKRQISAIHVAGDFVDLHSLLLQPMDHSVGALTDCRVVTVPHPALRAISASQPHLTRLLWLLTLIDSAIFRQWLVASGHLQAVGQIAHFFCEMHTRLEVVGLTDGLAFDLPISQADLGDAMGLSAVHVNRCLRTLREEGILEWNGGRAVIRDWDAARDLSEFDPGYLNLQCRPR